MDFITIPLVVGMITLGIYKLFELFVRKRERLTIIEKIGDKFDASMIDNKFSFPTKAFSNISYVSLKVGCLLVGVGLGLMVGFAISSISFGDYNLISVSFRQGAIDYDKLNQLKEIAGIVYGASVFIFGGIGLLVAFILEMKYAGKSKNN